MKDILVSFSIVYISLAFSSCPGLKEMPDSPVTYPNRFSVKNETNAELSIHLIPGIVPSTTALYSEFTPIQDELYKLAHEQWAINMGTKSTVRKNRHNAVYNHLPIINLCSNIDDEDRQLLREALLDKIVTFKFTISSGNKILYEIVGWDISDEEMERHGIYDKMYGYFDTKEENYFNGFRILSYPKLFSKHYGKYEYGFPGNITYYIRIKNNSFSFVKFDFQSLYGDDAFWYEN